MKIAFLIIAHKSLDSVFRLCRTLLSSAKDNNVEIFIHFDSEWHVSISDYASIKSMAHIIPESLHCKLDDKSLIEAEIKLIEFAYAYANFDYYALLSGQDYPIKRVDEMCEVLERIQPRSIIDVVPCRWNFVHFKFTASPRYKYYNNIMMSGCTCQLNFQSQGN